MMKFFSFTLLPVVASILVFGNAFGEQPLSLLLVRNASDGLLSYEVQADKSSNWASHRVPARTGIFHQFNSARLRLAGKIYPLNRGYLYEFRRPEDRAGHPWTLHAFRIAPPDTDQPQVEERLAGAKTSQQTIRQLREALETARNTIDRLSGKPQPTANAKRQPVPKPQLDPKRQPSSNRGAASTFQPSDQRFKAITDAFARSAAGVVFQRNAATLRTKIEPTELGQAVIELRIPIDGLRLIGLSSAPVSISIETDQKLVTASVAPATATLTESTSHLMTHCRFANVYGGSSLSGRILIKSIDGSRTLWVVPFVAEVRGQINLSQLRKGQLAVVTWPQRCRVWISRVARSPDSFIRAFAGTTPLLLDLPQGNWQVELAAPNSAAGHWLSPDTDAGRNNTSEPSPILKVHVPMDGEPALVRAIWLSGDGPFIDQLETASQHAPDRFPIAKRADFDAHVEIAFGRCGIDISSAQLDRLYRVAKRTGYLPYETGVPGSTVEILVPCTFSQHRYSAFLVRPAAAKMPIATLPTEGREENEE